MCLYANETMPFVKVSTTHVIDTYMSVTCVIELYTTTP